METTDKHNQDSFWNDILNIKLVQLFLKAWHWQDTTEYATIYKVAICIVIFIVMSGIVEIISTISEFINRLIW